MKLTVLVDNNTLIDRYYFSEPAVSYWIEESHKWILFDLGYSSLFIKNARLLNIDLKKARVIVLSHGHFDHTGGLGPYLRLAGTLTRHIELVAHPSVFERKVYEGFGDIGIRRTRKELEGRFKLNVSRTPLWLTKNLCFLGEIPRENDFEAKRPLGQVIKDGQRSPDHLWDDSALAYRSPKGIVVITGCSHSGICNILAYAKKVCGMEKVRDVIGGYHLLNAKRELLRKTISYLASCKITNLHPCHCTDLNAKIELGKRLPVQEVGTGLVLNYE